MALVENLGKQFENVMDMPRDEYFEEIQDISRETYKPMENLLKDVQASNMLPMVISEESLKDLSEDQANSYANVMSDMENMFSAPSVVAEEDNPYADLLAPTVMSDRDEQIAQREEILQAKFEDTVGAIADTLGSIHKILMNMDTPTPIPEREKDDDGDFISMMMAAFGAFSMKKLAGKLIGSIFGYIGKSFKTVFGNLGKLVPKSLVKGIGNVFGKMLKPFQAIGSFFSKTSKVLGPFAKGAKTFLKSIPMVGTVISIIWGVFDGIMGFINASDITGKSEDTLTIFDRFLAGLSGFLDGLISPILAIINFFKKDDIEFGAKEIYTMLTELPNDLLEFFKNILSLDFGAAFGPIIDWSKQAMDDFMPVIDGVKSFLSNIMSILSSLASLDFSGAGGKVLDIGKKALSFLRFGGEDQPAEIKPVELTPVKNSIKDNTFDLSKQRFEESTKAPIVTVQPAPVVVQAPKESAKPDSRAVLNIEDFGLRAMQLGTI